MTTVEQVTYDNAVARRSELLVELSKVDAVIAEAHEALEIARRRAAESIPVDRSARVLVGGAPLTDDYRDINPNTGMQKAYVVLSAEERAKGFVRPYRYAYSHTVCGRTTTMHRDLSETYARDPKFYNATYCGHCRGHFPVGENGEFFWCEADGSQVCKVGT